MFCKTICSQHSIHHGYNIRPNNLVTVPFSRTSRVRKSIRYHIPTLLNSFPPCITDKLNTHNLHGFCSYLTKYLLGHYQDTCTVPNCYVCRHTSANIRIFRLFIVTVCKIPSLFHLLRHVSFFYPLFTNWQFSMCIPEQENIGQGDIIYHCITNPILCPVSFGVSPLLEIIDIVKKKLTRHCNKRMSLFCHTFPYWFDL